MKKVITLEIDVPEGYSEDEVKSRLEDLTEEEIEGLTSNEALVYFP